MKRFNQPNQPPAPGPREPIIRVRANQARDVVVLSEAWWAIVVHWEPTEKRSFPCYVPQCECERCARELPKRWRAYLHVLVRQGGKYEEGFLELTPGMADYLNIELGEGVDLRGQRWRLERGNGEKARVRIAVQPHHSAISKDPLPPARSPEMDLMRLWGFLKRRPGDSKAS